MDSLIEQRAIVEYELANLRIADGTGVSNNHELVNHGVHYDRSRNDNIINYRCVLHKSNSLPTEEYATYLSKSIQERFNVLKNVRSCWSCLKSGHRLNNCKDKKVCGVDDCVLFHHKSLHDTEQTARVYVVNSKLNTRHDVDSTRCFLPLMKMKSYNEIMFVLWDSGATISLITFQKAAQLNLKGKRVELSVVKVGGTS